MKKYLNYSLMVFVISFFSGLSIACAAQALDVNAFLGDAADIIKRSTQVQSAGVRIISVEESQKQMFKTDSTLVGYPIAGILKKLNSVESKKLASILLLKENYANIRQRCLNESMQGVRFTSEQYKVEVVVGIPCNQVTIAFVKNNEVKFWGGVLGEKPSRDVLEYLK